jgi:hypothetical protein
MPRRDGGPRLLGQSLARLDIPANGEAARPICTDMRLPGMLPARVVRGPERRHARQDRRLRPRIEKLPGVVKIVREGRFLAVIADQEWRAVRRCTACRLPAGSAPRRRSRRRPARAIRKLRPRTWRSSTIAARRRRPTARVTARGTAART